MPVSTRSQLSGWKSGELCGSPGLRRSFIKNPHQGLKEKMKALTALYEQHKQPLAPSHQLTIDLIDCDGKKLGEDKKKEQEEMKKRREGESGIPKKKTTLFPKIEAKENFEPKFSDGVSACTMPRKAATAAGAAARRTSTGSMSDGRVLMGITKNNEEFEAAEDMGSRIMVFVRLRPMGKKEDETGLRSCVRIVNKRDVYLTDCASETDYLRLKRVRGRHFCFDASFPESTSQQEVYSTTTTKLVESVLEGRNGSVFCYGATGAGKTYTMLGTMENPGVMALAMKDLFSKIKQKSLDGKHSVLLSYLEVYNETVRDLLSPGRPLILREDKQGIIAAGLTQYRAYSTDEVMKLLQQGNLNRTTEPTRVNETSSRSHAILQVVAEYQVKNSVNVVTRVGKLSLIDLAGSERALATDQRSQRSIEGANINRSLLALSSCINALVEGKKHIPYRNSKLTQLLKDSLGGPCNTVMIANISPSHISFNETQNTLHWADRAKEIRNKACPASEEAVQISESETENAKLMLELQKENIELREQTVLLQQKIMTAQAQALASNSPQQQPPAPCPLPCTPSAKHRRHKLSILGGANCFSTPDSTKRKTAAEKITQELQRRVEELETEIERLKSEHIVQLKQKDDLIRELILKEGAKEGGDKVKSSVGKRGSMVKKDLKSPSHGSTSPQTNAKKRSFWATSAANSPSVVAANGRKTRSHVAPQSPPVPSMILPPGFAWTKQNAASRQ
ncbi:kinesin-like protein KIN-8A isoform X2 [Phalaenopsis equestris]|uniref:kinesin-like protein KIN-8A isoform X2 n=1 Tax=Phalaenopsis equestris TaxID=78828 RepID=UPI0009E424CA|nr:kinesin-like protein KIN-8A isoform X2 [Phalaenopsis equestris]